MDVTGHGGCRDRGIYSWFVIDDVAWRNKIRLSEPGHCRDSASVAREICCRLVELY